MTRLRVRNELFIQNKDTADASPLGCLYTATNFIQMSNKCIKMKKYV